MSRSYRTTPIRGMATTASEKKDKKLWHRCFRRINRHCLLCKHPLMLIREVSNTRNMVKNGKYYFLYSKRYYIKQTIVRRI